MNMMTSTVAHNSQPTRLSAVPSSKGDRRHSMRRGDPIAQETQTLSWTPDLVLAQSPEERDDESQRLMQGIAHVLDGGLEQFGTAGDEAWDLLMHALLQSGALQASGAPIDNADMLVRRNASFALNGGASNRLHKEVGKWIQDLVAADSSLFDYTLYTMEALTARIVQESTAALGSGNLYKAKGRHEGKVDVPIIRFTDARRPFLTVYRIRVDVWSSKQRAFVVRQSDEMVLSGQYNVRYFQLRGEPTSTVEGAAFRENVHELIDDAHHRALDFDRRTVTSTVVQES